MLSSAANRWQHETQAQLVAGRSLPVIVTEVRAQDLGRPIEKLNVMKWISLAPLLLMFCGSWSPPGIEAEKVLGFFHFPGRSHFVMFEALMKELAARGHQVTVVSHFPQKTPIANWTDVDLAGSIKYATGGFLVQYMKEYGVRGVLRYIWDDMASCCDKVLQHPSVEKLAKSDEHFDLVVFEIFGVDCCYGFPWKFKAPAIGMTSLPRMPFGQMRVGNPENPAYHPMVFLEYSTRMPFMQRLQNSLWTWYIWIVERIYIDPLIQHYNHRLFGPDIPPIQELMFNTSLILLNSHFSLNGALPAVPAVVEVGGMHVHPNRRELPKALADWLDGADDRGVVYVSFGSLARAEEMPLPQMRAMANVLGSLPQRVLWKCQGDIVEKRLGHKLPANILTDNWIPQADVLAHPKTKVFVAHAGLMGTQEAVFWGKPMMVVPLFSDQLQIAYNLVIRGMALELRFDDINENTFGKVLDTLLNDPSYAKNARHLSSLFRDRPRPPLQEAVYWSEYVMRHRGAPHLRSAAVHLSWWQHWLLDVIAATFLALAVILLLLRFVFRLLLRLLFRRPSQTEKKHKRS